MRIKQSPIRSLHIICMVAAAAFMTACGLGSVPPATIGVETQIAHGVAAMLTTLPAQPATTIALPPTDTAVPASLTPANTATPEATATATTRATLPVPTAVTPVATDFPGAVYTLDQELISGEYAARVWRNTVSPDSGLGFDTLLTLEQTGAAPIVVPYFAGFDPLNGTDLTADGVPELIATTYTGGAHCCFGFTIYSLGDTPAKILESRPGNCGGQFTDLDGDGMLEFITCDDIFAYTYCPFAASPTVQAILAYDPAAGAYAAAGPRFADQYAADLPALRARAENAVPGELGEWDETTKCGVLPYVLALLYSGQPDQAWSELARVYTVPDESTFQQDIEQTVGTSQYFTLP